jgi:hypothetical protein
MSVFRSILNVLRFNRRNWRAVVLCIFAATIFWFLNALNKSYTTNLNFPLRFDYDKTNFVPVRSLPRQVRINVTGNGWDLFKQSTGVKNLPLEIPLERPADVKKIVGSTLPVFFSSQIDGLQINFVLTDTLYVDLEPKSGRWIKLAMDSLDANLKAGYGVASEVSIIPDSIFIEGPKRLIEEFEEPVQLKLQQFNLDDRFAEDVEIAMPSDVIKRDPPTVSVMFNVEKLTTVQDSVLIAVENVPPTVSYVEEKYIPITVQIPQSMQARLRLDSARAVLNLKNFKRGEAKIFPRLKGLPPFTKVVKVDSVRIRL